MMTNLNQIYESQILTCETKITRLKKLLVIVSVTRFVSFLVVVTTPFYLYPVNAQAGVGLPLFALILFFFLVKKYQVLSRKKRFEQLKVKINQQELEALRHNFSIFDSGEEFIDPGHINAYDLDLFGKGSLFQFVNRSVTRKGKIKLAEMLQQPILAVEKLKRRQELILELADQNATNWRQNFSTQGKMYDEEEQESLLLDKWGGEEFSLKTISFVRYLLVILPALGIGTILFWIYTGNVALFLFSLVVQMIFWLVEKDNIKVLYDQFGKRANILEKYGLLLQYIENFEWKSDEGKE